MPDPSPQPDLIERLRKAVEAARELATDDDVVVVGYANELAAGAAPEWIKLVPAEEFAHPVFGVTNPTPEFRELLVANFNRLSVDLVLDYNHQSLKAMSDGVGKAPAAAFFDRLENRDDGVYGHVGLWSDDGEAAVRRRDYRWVSPVIAWMARDRRNNGLIGPALHSVGLTNTPQIDSLPDITAAYSQPSPAAPTKEPSMKYAALFALLGLADTASDEEAVAAFNTKLDEAKSSAEPPAELAEYSAKAAELETEVANLKGQLAAAPSLAMYANLQAELLQAQAKAQVLEDRIPPGLHDTAIALYCSSTEEYATFASGVPKVPAGVLRNPDNKGGGGNGDGLTDVERQLCAQYSIEPKDFIAQREARRAARG